ncbi:MAG: F0F1 ATP synthase subunit alpha [Patescibacteria group bacterium]|nr:F0F1 ATP synthase subunit alpha [Patescibacteria group bacterium]
METYEILKKEIEKLELTPEKEEIGEVEEVKDGVVRISGLSKVGNFELINFERAGIEGLVLNLEEESVGAIVLGDFSKIKEGDIVKRKGKILSVGVGESLLGRVIDPLGNPLDGKGEIKAKEFYPLERIGPGVVEREPVNFPLQTGIKLIDALVPIGRGQRELFLGDRTTEKSDYALTVILNQKNEPKRPICIYVPIGKKESEIAKKIEILEKAGAMEYTIIVAASASLPISFWYLAPYAGCAQAEYFMKRGKDALIIYDDLTQHAYAWRQIALILRRPPGREAYPGDVFYLHSRLLERAAKLNKEKGGGSLTAIPIIETQAGDITGYIPTNVISICDGQIYFDSSLYLKGQKPEVNIGLSVSRVGSAAQTKAMKGISATLKLELAQFLELERFLEFIEEVDPETRKRLERGKRIREILKQEKLSPLSLEKEVVSIYAAVEGFLDKLKIEDIKNFEMDLDETIANKKPEIFSSIREKRDLDLSTKLELDKLIQEVAKKYETAGDKK